MWSSTSKRQTSSDSRTITSTTPLSKENESDFTIETEEDVTPFLVLSVIYQANKLGAAYYNIDTRNLCLMPDHVDAAPFSLLRLLLKETEPICIITSARTDENVLQILKETSRTRSSVESNNSCDNSRGKSKLHILPNLDFALEACKHRLQNLHLLNLPQKMNDFERRIHLSSLIDFSSICMIKAAGALLKFVENDTFEYSLDGPARSIISAITTLSLKNVLNIDENSYRALQIFQEERHPSVYKSTFGTKEGLSLYGICNRCKSAIGKKELKRWFLMPTNDFNLIKERQEAIKYFISPKNSDILSALQGSLKHIKFLPRILTRMKTAQATMTDWQSLYRTAYHAMLIGDICRSQSECLNIFNEISLTFSTDLFRISSLLNKIIDFDEYAKQNHFVVKPGVDSELDKMKRTYNGLPDFMTQVAYQELQELSSDVSQCSVIYLPQLGYLLTIPATKEMKETKNYTIPNLRFMFIVNDVVHYKSENTKKLDSLLGDTLCDIYDKETQIMHKLQNVILEMKSVLFDVMEYSSKLDCLIALAVTAKEYNWIQPELATDGQLTIIKGRHPLQEICVSSFVANDIYSGDSESKIKVLTGPNSSGKSIYLTQVALLVYMIHLGSFVPAQKAKIPLFDSIFTCINTLESVSLNLSSFIISLNQLSCALNKATNMSLVIVDEFGKYTEARSGEALVVASLKFWAQKGPSSPHVLLATHFLNLNSYFPENYLIKFQTMDVIEIDDLVFLYQLVDGVASSSLATYTALRAGLPKEIVKRSVSILQSLKASEPISLEENNPVFEKLRRYFLIHEEFKKLNTDSNNLRNFLLYVKDTAIVSSPFSSNSGISSKSIPIDNSS